MIVWLASYPRSGNTFCRIVLHRLYGVPTYVVYDVDGVAERIGGELIGFRERPASLETMRSSDELYVVKTHRQRDTDVAADDRMICLVRDGRDAVVSWARMVSDGPAEPNSEGYQDRYEAEIQRMVTRPDPIGTGAWGRNVLSWLTPPAPHRVVLRYHELVADPAGSVREAVTSLVPNLLPTDAGDIPSFSELRQVDDRFFRRGTSGTHRDELPEHLHELFWAQPDNVAAMDLLGYPR